MRKKDNSLIWLIIALLIAWFVFIKKNIFNNENIDSFNNSDSTKTDSNGNVQLHYGNDKGGIDIGVNLFN